MSRKMIILVLAGLVGVLACYACFPRRVDLRSFDAAAMAKIETTMWRDYYEKKYLSLFGQLYGLARSQYGFSPLDSVRIAVAAANAAKIFQPTTSRAEAAAALPSLATYYGLLRKASPVAYDVQDAARLELDWWQARREASGPETYGLTVAAVAALIYGKSKDDPTMVASGIARAKAMATRDKLGASITDADWSGIEAQLLNAYQLLKSATENP